MKFEGKVAIVTGASRGIGAALAIALAREGARVACVARATKQTPQRTPGTLDDTVARAKEVGGEVLAVPANLASRDEVVAMARHTQERLGPVDLLINNAGILFFGSLLNQDQKRHDLTMAVNLDAPMIAMREVLPGMRERGVGAILNVSSGAAVNPVRGCMSYGMAKAAVERMTIDVALQMRSRNIPVNCLRIDMSVASEGYVTNQPEVDHSQWEKPETAADCMLWMLRQPADYTGRIESMSTVKARL